MSERRPWPEWFRYTLTALAGVATTSAIAALAFGEVRRDAALALRGVEVLEPRVRAAEDLGKWLKAAMKTGRDPDTGSALPFGK